MNIPGPTQATLSGLAVGDALGMPFETMSYRDPALESWKMGEFRASEHHGLKPGQWTDDTMMARALGQSLVAHRTYAPADAAKRYLEWYKDPQERRGMGKTTERSLSKLAHGIPWTQTGDPDSLGNGAAMRMAPMGLMFRDNIQGCAEMAKIDARITHTHPEAVTGAIAVAVGVCAIAQGRATPFNVIEKVLGFLHYDSLVTQKLKQVQVYITDNHDGPIHFKVVDMGVSANVVDTVPAAFLAFAGTESYAQAVEAAIRAGGDTDTTAAIAGALAGTYYGIEQVAPFTENLEAANELRALERQLYVTAPPTYQP